MDVDADGGDADGDADVNDDEDESDDGEDVDETTAMLVGESGLESTSQLPCLRTICQINLGWTPQNPRNDSCASSLLLCIVCHQHLSMYVSQCSFSLADIPF